MKKQSKAGSQAYSEKTNGGLHQTVSGKLSLSSPNGAEEGRKIKVAASRDGVILASQTLAIEAGQQEVEFDLGFDSDAARPIGVRILAGPDVADDRLASADSQEVWVKASQFEDNRAQVNFEIAEEVFVRWIGWCRTYRLRGRVVCREWRYDTDLDMFVFCDAPVRGAKVKAFDVDHFWWWFRRDEVGTAYTDADGFFEISFKWCCWPWHPWLFDHWALDPSVLGEIRQAVAGSERPIPLPEPDSRPDISLLQTLGEGAARFMPGDARGGQASARSVGQLGEQLLTLLPESNRLERLRIWPWYPIHDCRPDIVFEVEQDCGEGPLTIYQETTFQARWDIPQVVEDIVLLANDDACCAPSCQPDPPDGECLAIKGVGRGSYPIGSIEQDHNHLLAGYQVKNSADRLFAGTIPILGVFGDSAQLDYYRPERRRIRPNPTAWEVVPPNEVAAFTRLHWIGPPLPYQKAETVGLIDVGGVKVLKTVERYQAENNDVHPHVLASGYDTLFHWKTAQPTVSPKGGTHQAGLEDGVYELRIVGYRLGGTQANPILEEVGVMPICQGPGEEIDPEQHASLVLRLDNRVWKQVPGSITLDTSEPECEILSVTVERNGGGNDPVQACGFARVEAGDTLRIRFRATDSEAHLGGYQMTAHWGNSLHFNVLAAGTLAGESGALVGPNYHQTLQPSQGNNRPGWPGGIYQVAVPVDGLVPGSPHKAFATCCAFQLDLKTWRRTTNGGTSILDFHTNRSEYSFTVIRSDLIGQPGHPGCTSLCEDPV